MKPVHKERSHSIVHKSCSMFSFLSINYFYYIVTSLVLVLIFNTSFALNDSKDLVLTLSEKNGLDMLKSQVLDSLPEKFMQNDFYLIRWLRVANLDVAKAKTLLLENVKWRQQNNISNILNEDWTDMEIEYGMSFGGHDKEGRPIMTLDIGDWDLRAAALQGKTQRLQRYLTFSNERGMQGIFKEQEKGNPVTRFVVIVDADGLNLRQHLCPSCMSVLIYWSSSETYYPMFTEEIVIINAPSIVSFVLNTIRPFLAASTRDQMKVFNTNRDEWQAYLDKKIDKSQRSQRYGGTMP